MAEVFEPKLRTSTIVQYQGLITNHLTPLRGVRLSKMTVEVLEEIFRDKSKGRRTREMLRRFLIMSLNHAVRLGLVRENVARRTLPVGGQPKLVNGLSLGEIKAILGAASNPTMRTAFRTQVELGLRVGELLGMHWRDIDWEARTVSVERQLQRDRRTSQLVLGPLKTAKSRRVLPLSDSLIQELRPLQGTGPFVFSSEASGPIEPRNYNRSLSIASKRAGVGHVCSHRLRHSYASWALGLGVDIGIISRALGHSQISTTMRYAAATPEVIREGNSKVAKLLEGVTTHSE
jgi:integrase